MPPVCPQCRRAVAQVDGFWSCPKHGEVTPVDDDGAAAAPQPATATPAAAPKPKIFISYGRRDAAKLVDRLSTDLGAAGFDVWRDTGELRAGTDWQAEIVDGLRSVQVVVAVMTPHSVRTSTTSDEKVDSVCLGEIAYALFNPPPTPVVPAMAATCEPPLALFHLDYVDLRAWSDADEQYRAGLARLVDGIWAALRGEKRYRRWHHQLQPIDFASFLHLKRRNFHGRRKLFDTIDAWRTASSSERALLVKGDPGVGKSAVVAELVHRNPDGQVLAYHCCQWDVGETLSAARFVRNLAAMVASKLEAYAALLEHDPAVRDALDRAEAQPDTALVAGLLTPLERLPAPDGGPRYILIDALDEALLTPPGEPSIVDMLASKIERLPGWLRLVATTRNDPTVLGRLGGLRAELIDAQTTDNLDDVRGFLDEALAEPNLAERLVQAGLSAAAVRDQIVTCSAGNFLYVRQTLEAILRDQIDLADIHRLPPGLAGMYEQRFARQFPDETSFAAAKRVFEILAAAQEPLSEPELAAATGLDPDDELAPTLRKLESYVPRRLDVAGDARFTFFHKSLGEWLTDPQRRGLVSAVAPRAGHRRLAEVGWREYRQGAARLSPYSLQHLPAHLIAAERWDDLERLLTDLAYYEGRNAAGQVFQLAGDLSAAWRALSGERSLPASATGEEAAARRMRLKLLDEALRRDIHFIHRHRNDYPQALFQCLWNHAWWYDCPAAAEHYVDGVSPGAEARVGLHALLERWRREKQAAEPNFKWIRALRPPPIHLDTALVAVLRGHEGWVWSAAFSADGSRIVSGSDDNTVRVWDAQSGVEQLTLRGHDGQLTSVAFSPDGRRIVSGSRDTTVRVWDARSGDQLRVLCGHRHVVSSVAFSPDGLRIVSGSSDQTVRVWDVGSGAERLILRGHEGAVSSVAFSSDGSRIAGGSNDKTVRLWDARSGAELHVCRGHQDWVTSVAFSPDGSQIAGGSSDRTVRTWDARSGAELRILRGHEDEVWSVAFSPDGSRIAGGSSDKTVRLWDARSGAELHVLRGHENEISSLAFSPNGSRIVSGARDDVVRVWDARSGVEQLTLRGHENRVESVAFSPDAARVVSCSWDKTVRVWDARSGVEQLTLRGHQGQLSSVAFSSDGSRIVSGSYDCTVRVWDARSGAEEHVFRGPVDWVTSVAFSPDGTRIVSGSDDKTVRVWDARSGAELHVLRGHEGWVGSVAFSPDGSRIVSGSSDQTVRVWDAESGAELHVLSGHDDWVKIAAFSPDGTRVVSGSSDRTVRVWDAFTGECLEMTVGTGDISVAAAGAETRFTYLALLADQETAIGPAGGGRPAAWFPDQLACIGAHPASRVWSGSVANYVCLLELEGLAAS